MVETGRRPEAALSFALVPARKKALDSADRRGAPCGWLVRGGAPGQSGAQTAPALTRAHGRGRPRGITRELGSRHWQVVGTKRE